MFTNKQMYTNVHKWDWILCLGLLLVGTVIFFFSLYTASLSGLRRQIGIVGGELSNNVDTNLLYRGLVEAGALPTCDYLKAVKPIPKYLFAEGDEKVRLSRELAEDRIRCGISYSLAGNSERGLYTVLKGLRYELVGSIELEKMINLDKRACEQSQSSVSWGMVEAYLESSSGSVRGVVEREYQEVERLRAKIVELCEV